MNILGISFELLILYWITNIILGYYGQVKHVYYPGLPSHPEHDLAKRQMTGFGGVVSFEVSLDDCLNVLSTGDTFSSLSASISGIPTCVFAQLCRLMVTYRPP